MAFVSQVGFLVACLHFLRLGHLYWCKSNMTFWPSHRLLLGQLTDNQGQSSCPKIPVTWHTGLTYLLPFIRKGISGWREVHKGHCRGWRSGGSWFCCLGLFLWRLGLRICLHSSVMYPPSDFPTTSRENGWLGSLWGPFHLGVSCSCGLLVFHAFRYTQFPGPKGYRARSVCVVLLVIIFCETFHGFSYLENLSCFISRGLGVPSCTWEISLSYMSSNALTWNPSWN